MGKRGAAFRDRHVKLETVPLRPDGRHVFRDQPCHPGPGHQAHDRAPLRFGPPAVDPAHGRFHFLQLGKQGLAVARQPVTRLASRKKLSPDLLLEVQHAPADRGRAEARRLRCPGQPAMARDGQEYLVGVPSYVFHE